jgi:hypothetical protein
MPEIIFPPSPTSYESPFVSVLALEYMKSIVGKRNNII